jgi:hypothetical protein
LRTHFGRNRVDIKLAAVKPKPSISHIASKPHDDAIRESLDDTVVATDAKLLPQTEPQHTFSEPDMLEGAESDNEDEEVVGTDLYLQ